MAVDPSLCPIPPGFEVIDGFSDDFEQFKETTGYGNPLNPFREQGWSYRWKNDKITAADMVAGFQFKIGPKVGWRWKDNPLGTHLRDVKSGDVTLHFPRREPWSEGVRGGYLVGIKWQVGTPPHRPFVAEGSLGKEIPHGTYHKGNGFFDNKLSVAKPTNRVLPGPVMDGQWHSFLGVIFNDFYNNVGRPMIGLWYSPIATHKFEDFMFLGMGIDNGRMPPSVPLTDPMGGDATFKIEHALQIRIDDVDPDQIKIQNTYAANVRYVGPPPNPNVCIPEARAISDAQVTIDKLVNKANEAHMNMIKPGIGFGSEEFNIWRDIHENLINVEIPNARRVLGIAKFNYGECRDLNWRRKRPFDSLRRWLQITDLDASQGVRSIMSSFSVSSIRQLIGSP